MLVTFHRADGELEQHDPTAAERDFRPAVGAADGSPQAPVRVQLVAVGEEQLVQTRAADLLRAFGEPDDRVRRPCAEVSSQRSSACRRAVMSALSSQQPRATTMSPTISAANGGDDQGRRRPPAARRGVCR